MIGIFLRSVHSINFSKIPVCTEPIEVFVLKYKFQVAAKSYFKPLNILK